jgi:hypothetical protein
VKLLQHLITVRVYSFGLTEVERSMCDLQSDTICGKWVLMRRVCESKIRRNWCGGWRFLKFSWKKNHKRKYLVQ